MCSSSLIAGAPSAAARSAGSSMTRAKSAPKREGSAAKAGHALSPSLNLRLIWWVRGAGWSRVRVRGEVRLARVRVRVRVRVRGEVRLARGAGRSRARGEGSVRAEREGRCTGAGADHRDDRHDVRP